MDKKRAELWILAVAVTCPYCDEEVETNGGSIMWDIGQEELPTKCNHCDKTFNLPVFDPHIYKG